ncbi:hypothetical protein ACEN2I_17675 [Flavobacterium sp. W22_SRS_FK3]|uniref:hypothetical protein n=1 Tax=Flavobacterium sp. W22_SRS_FK3 TaxID=3240275 RepID=UPI003F8E72E2
MYYFISMLVFCMQNMISIKIDQLKYFAFSPNNNIGTLLLSGVLNDKTENAALIAAHNIQALLFLLYCLFPIEYFFLPDFLLEIDYLLFS